MKPGIQFLRCGEIGRMHEVVEGRAIHEAPRDEFLEERPTEHESEGVPAGGQETAPRGQGQHLQTVRTETVRPVHFPVHDVEVHRFGQGV